MSYYYSLYAKDGRHLLMEIVLFGPRGPPPDRQVAARKAANIIARTHIGDEGNRFVVSYVKDLQVRHVGVFWTYRTARGNLLAKPINP